MIIRKSFLMFFVAIQLSAVICFAQEIKLKDVAKINFILTAKTGDISFRDIKLVKEGSLWKSYLVSVSRWDQQSGKYLPDTEKAVIRTIKPVIIANLVEGINHPDTLLNFRHSGLDRDRLLTNIDSLNELMAPAEKAEFVQAINTDSTIIKSIVGIMHGVESQDNGTLTIIITTTNGKTYTVKTGNGWYYAQYLPHIWYHNNSPNYNLNLQLAFDYVSKDDEEIQADQSRLYRNIDFAIYQRSFETRFKWANFKQTQPALFAALSKTITPHSFAQRDRAGGDTFKSSRLPAFVVIGRSSFKADSAAVWSLNKYEDTLATLFNKPNFLFNYIKDKKGAGAHVIKYGDMDTEKIWYFNSIKKEFPMIGSYDIKQVHFIRVVEADGNLSYWLLLGDKAVVLAHYTGELKGDYMATFNGITPDPNARGGQKNLKSVCMLFDSQGNHLFGNTDRVYLGLFF